MADGGFERWFDGYPEEPSGQPLGLRYMPIAGWRRRLDGWELCLTGVDRRPQKVRAPRDVARAAAMG